MSDYVWGIIIVGSIIYSLFCGNIADVAAAVPAGCKEAVTLFITVAANMIFWSGVLRIAKDSGLDKKIAGFMSPVISLVFPRMKKDNPARGLIAQNMAVNLLGLGSAATPLGLAAMRELSAQSKYGAGVASPDMIRFVLVNTSTVQLLPTTIAAMRSHHGSASPFDIMLPMFMVSLLSVCCGLLLNALLERRERP